MSRLIPRLTVLAALWLANLAHAQVILQDFSSTAGANTFFYGTWEATGNNGGSTSPNSQFLQGSGVFDITGDGAGGHILPTNDANSKVEFFNTSPVSIGPNTSLSITAQALPTNAASSFTVTLVDTFGHTAFATFNASAFITGSYTTSTASLTFQSGFNSSQIDSMILTGGQLSGTDRFNMSFDTISASAVPEPGTYAAIAGAAALGVAAWRRRRAATR